MLVCVYIVSAPSDTRAMSFPPSPFSPIAGDCSFVGVGVGVGGASGGFIGGVLLSAAIAGCVAAAVFYRDKCKPNAKAV